MKFGILLLIALASGGESLNILKKGIVVGMDTVKAGLNERNKFLNSLPIPKAFEHVKKKYLLSIPMEFAMTILDNICKQLIESKYLFVPILKELNFIYYADSGKQYIPLTEPSKLLALPDLQSKNKLVIFITGWIIDPNTDPLNSDIVEAFKCREGIIFLALDATEYLFSMYLWSAFDTEIVGKNLAEALKHLNTIIPAENIHLIGHSLGAHIAGYAGRYFTTLTGRKISRITGLDPARPCFSNRGLRASDAQFVDVIHTNVGVLGLRQAIGTVDLFANANSTAFVPGCWDIACSHLRAISYFIETIYPGNENNFMVDNRFPMGYAIPMNIQGSYEVEVNKYEPYGQNSSSTNYKNCQR